MSIGEIKSGVRPQVSQLTAPQYQDFSGQLRGSHLRLHMFVLRLFTITIAIYELTHLRWFMKTFYYSLRPDGVPTDRARIMWAAVRFFGPRWEDPGPGIIPDSLDCYLTRIFRFRRQPAAELGRSRPFDDRWFERYAAWMHIARSVVLLSHDNEATREGF